MKTIKLLAAIIAIFSCTIAAQAQTPDIIGTWKYINTALYHESAANIRKQLNSDERLEKKMNSSLAKVGFRAGSTLIFKDDGTFNQRVNGRSYEGTYTCSSDLKSLTLTFNNSEEPITMELDYQQTGFNLTVPADKYMLLVNVNKTKANDETLLFIRSLITQFENTKLVMKYNK